MQHAQFMLLYFVLLVNSDRYKNFKELHALTQAARFCAFLLTVNTN